MKDEQALHHLWTKNIKFGLHTGGMASDWRVSVEARYAVCRVVCGMSCGGSFAHIKTSESRLCICCLGSIVR